MTRAFKTVAVQFIIKIMFLKLEWENFHEKVNEAITRKEIMCCEDLQLGLQLSLFFNI